MPQMAPIGWLSLFMIFSLTFVMFNIMNYYLIIYKSNYKTTKLIKSKFNFKWMW